jgi:peptidoglycan DL-endopeptidase CwlO
VPSALVAALSAPIRQVQSLVGPGWSGDPFADPAVAFDRARDALTNVSAATRHAWDRTNWTGSGADAAAEFTASTVAAIDGLAARADQLSTAAGTASAAVARAHQRLRGIVDRFEARAQTLEPYLDSPGVAEQLTSEAQRSLDEAVAVVEELRAELDEHATVLATPTQSAQTPTAPAGLTSSAMPTAGLGPSGGSAPMSPLSNGLSGSGLGDLAQLMKPDAPATVPEAAAFGDGVAIRLPDGSTATAPNAVAASAVRHALTQLGVPYDWGGTTPGVGLDCSGLTQWAYSEAGLNLPRLAQEQDVGAPVATGDLRPGDLAVWDGHVAMIVGDGQMIEAGDPVKLSPIRTGNAGQGFQGFWRPTA